MIFFHAYLQDGQHYVKNLQLELKNSIWQCLQMRLVPNACTIKINILNIDRNLPGKNDHHLAPRSDPNFPENHNRSVLQKKKLYEFADTQNTNTQGRNLYFAFGECKTLKQ